MHSNYVQFNTPQFHILSDKQIEELHLATLQILERTGVTFECQEAIEILGNAGADVSNPDRVKIPSLSVSLWKVYGDTEPDVIIESTTQLIFIEAKLGSSASCEQLEREYKHGRKAKDRFSLFLLTKDFSEPEAMKEALGQLSPHFHLF